MSSASIPRSRISSSRHRHSGRPHLRRFRAAASATSICFFKKENQMRSDESREHPSLRHVGAIQLKLALIALTTLFVALPQLFSAHAGTGPRATQGILFVVTTAADHDDGVCDADCTLREALNAASN